MKKFPLLLVLLAGLCLATPSQAGGLAYFTGTTPSVGNLNTIAAYINNFLGYSGVIPIRSGGTGLATIGSSGQVLGVNAEGTALAFLSTGDSDVAGGNPGQVQYNAAGILGGTPLITISTTGLTIGTAAISGVATFSSTIKTGLGTAGPAIIGTTGILGSVAVLPISQGGTGLTTVGSVGQFIAVGTTGTSLVYTTPSAYYGSIYYDNAASPIVVTTTAAGTYYLVGSTATQSMSSGGANGATVDITNGHGDITVAAGAGGQYNVSYSLSYAGGVNNQVNTGYVYIGTSRQAACTSQTKLTQAGSIATSGNRCQLALVAGNTVTFKVTSDQAGGTISIAKINVGINRIGP